MSDSKRAATPLDDSLLLTAALERALCEGTDSIAVSTPPLVELPALVDVARRVEASAHAVRPGETFRAAGRARLLASMRESDAPVARPKPNRGGICVIISAWWARAAAAVSVVALAGAATASASASALPGDTLYPIKQIGEQVALATARDESAQRDVLFQQAKTRLDETSRLLDQGREVDAGESALRYRDTIERTADTSAGPAGAQLMADRARLLDLLATAPPQAQSGLRRAIAATDRRLERARPELPRPASQSDSERTLPAVIQAPSSVTAEQIPTPAPATVPEMRRAESSSQPWTPSGGAPANDDGRSGHGAAEAPPEQLRRGAPALKVVESDQSGGAAVKSDSPGEVRPLPAPAVDKPHTAPVTPVKPPRSRP
jgi:hypothetical protein